MIIAADTFFLLPFSYLIEHETSPITINTYCACIIIGFVLGGLAQKYNTLWTITRRCKILSLYHDDDDPNFQQFMELHFSFMRQ